MWDATRTFIVEDCQHKFPPTAPGALCPFCQQELSESSRERLQRLEFVRSTLDQELKTPRQALEELLSGVTPDALDRARASQGLALLKEERPEIGSRIERWLRAGLARCSALRAGNDALSLPPSDVEAVLDLAAKRGEEAAHQRSLVNPKQRDALRQRVAEGEGRLLLRERLSEITDWHGTLTTVAALELIRKDLDTTPLSHKQTDLAKELVTDALRSAAREELDALGFAHLKVDLSCRTDRGATVARMKLGDSTATVPEVLSTGEQRACALAFFLAEVRTSASSGGLVFDDPSASFDVERVEHIANRIVELAAKRQQVVVFTCDVVFAWCLQAAAEAAGVGLKGRPIARMGEKAGIVRLNQSWLGETLKARLGRLRTTLEKLEAHWRKGEVDEYEIGAKTFAGDIREAWERAIEEELFRGVVMRFQRDVKTLKIREVVVTPELTREVFDGISETSPYHHDAALAKPVATPTAEELRSFLDHLETFCGDVKKERAAKPRVA